MFLFELDIFVDVYQTKIFHFMQIIYERRLGFVYGFERDKFRIKETIQYAIYNLLYV